MQPYSSHSDLYIASLLYILYSSASSKYFWFSSFLVWIQVSILCIKQAHKECCSVAENKLVVPIEQFASQYPLIIFIVQFLLEFQCTH